MNIIKRIKMGLVARKMVKDWRELTGGACRYRFHVGGSSMEFTAPELKNIEELAEVLEEAARMIRATKRPVTNI